MKTCGNCRRYIPSPHRPETGNGLCEVMEDWEAKHRKRGTKPSSLEIEQAYLILGERFGTPQALWHPKSERERCQRFTLNKEDL